MQAFKKAGAEIIGVSGDDPESHANFKSKLGLPYTLLADEGNKVGPPDCVPARATLAGTTPCAEHGRVSFAGGQR